MFYKFQSVPDLIINDKNFDKLRVAAAEFNVIKKFYEIFPEFKSVVKPVKVSNGIVFLSVHNSIMRNEININKNLFIEKINKRIGQKIIKSIKFVL